MIAHWFTNIETWMRRRGNGPLTVVLLGAGILLIIVALFGTLKIKALAAVDLLPF